jgi:maleylacetoacetate isomerase
MPLFPSKLHLYHTALSGCSARIRIAAHLKRIPLIYHDLNLRSNEHQTEEYLSLNPNGSVPTLIVEYPNDQKFSITQSLPILEYFEDVSVDGVRLLPPVTDMRARVKVRELAALVACDIHPPQNLRIRAHIKVAGGDPVRFASDIITRGLSAYEKIVKESAGKYSVGDDVSLADVCLIPMLEGASRVGVDVGQWDVVGRIAKQCSKLAAFREGGTRA